MAAHATPMPFRSPHLELVHDTEPSPPPLEALPSFHPPPLSELDLFAIGVTRVDLSTPEAAGAVEALLDPRHKLLG
jgi:hypothetical protein